MAKSSAFGIEMKRGVCQIETAVVVGTITGSGNATFTLTKSGMTGSPIATSVAVLNGDTPTVVAYKAAAAMNLNSNITAVCQVTSSGPNVVVRALLGAANDATFNLAYTNDTCTGLTPDATSDDTQAGVAPVSVAYVKSLGGPGMSVDTIDVSTHDQTTAFEEVIPSIIRTGEVKLDLEFDPNTATHQGTSTGGLVYDLKTKFRGFWQIVFPGAVTWSFEGFVTAFEPSGPVDGDLTASATIKITGIPILA